MDGKHFGSGSCFADGCSRCHVINQKGALSEYLSCCESSPVSCFYKDSVRFLDAEDDILG